MSQAEKDGKAQDDARARQEAVLASVRARLEDRNAWQRDMEALMQRRLEERRLQLERRPGRER